MKNLLILLLAVWFLTGCNEQNLKDGDEQITEAMDAAISDYILEKNEDAFAPTEKQFEVHRVYGTSETQGTISVYMWSYYGGFNRATGTETQSGHSMPLVIRMSKNNDEYSVIEYIEPEDGSRYQPSLKKMFPRRYLKFAERDAGNLGELQKEMDKKVKRWLESQA
ncbi:hypothetical protein LCM10_03665 [Rossellomorea aquimaris]|uniref:hypothetical protein n=1 Tax=Rossellomorea aquimaris TaxID=189382 RepID=UPI001CD76A03|nr:hypothetical protein [Rossellomorea aquimaris]MCA1054073.1 hypothetical protein [Rossellomorea aquimaris]